MVGSLDPATLPLAKLHAHGLSENSNNSHGPQRAACNAVYALGLYVDEQAAQKSLSTRFPNADVNELASIQKLCDGESLYHTGVSMSLNLLCMLLRMLEKAS